MLVRCVYRYTDSDGIIYNLFQQHGSVYWSRSAEELLAALSPEKSLFDQLCPRAFSVSNSPIWQDSSTTQECKELEEGVGGPQALADITGSRGYERFTGSQIKKVSDSPVVPFPVMQFVRQIRCAHPASYENTEGISLVSSFIASLFLGKIAPIDASDASGMNLMDVLSHKWVNLLLETAGGNELREKLKGEPVEGGLSLGNVHQYWVQRWGFRPGTSILIPRPFLA